MGTSKKSQAPFDLSAVVARIEERIAELKTNPSVVSGAAGLSSSYIRNLQRGAKGEIGVTSPRVDALMSIAHVLGLNVGWLVTGKGPRLAADETGSDLYEAIEKFEAATPKVRRRTLHFMNTMEDD